MSKLIMGIILGFVMGFSLAQGYYNPTPQTGDIIQEPTPHEQVYRF